MNLNNKGIKVAGTISPHQWGIVADRGGEFSDNSNDKLENANYRFKKVPKEIEIIGVVGNTDRQNRNRGRVIKNVCPAIASRDFKDALKVIKKWRRT